MPLLQVSDLRVQFRTERGPLGAVDGVSFELEAGRTLGIVGESGCGKTVLSRSLLKLNPIAGGSVIFDGRDLVAMEEEELNDVRGRDISIVFQDPMTSLNPVLTIGYQIAESLTHHLKMSRAGARTRARELLAAVGIPSPDGRLNEYPHQLSGGMRQRVTIAMALSCEPRLLIADEPTTALDVTVQAQILDLLKQQQRQRGMAMILISHDLGVVAGRTDEIAVHGGAAAGHPAPGSAEPLPPAGDRWPAARPGGAPAGLPLFAPLRVREGPVPRRRALP